MEEETKDQAVETKLSFKTADELTTFLLDLQGQIANLQETVDKLSPVEEKAEEAAETVDDEVSEEELSEIDRLLQAD